ncbi:MAG: hypothetical protein WBD59_21705 [Candidatus Sulfotelmatobacter sp.]
MIDTSLGPEKTVVSAKGDGASVDLSAANSRIFLVVLHVSRIIEQEAIEISIMGSADGATWDPKPVLVFPQKFYCGQDPLLTDLTQHPNVKYIRAHWEVARWGRGTETPMFEFGLKLQEVPADMLSKSHSGSGISA